MVEKAKKKAKALGELNNSITGGEGNIAGYIGEEMVRRFINGRVKDTYDHDLHKNGVTLDVKTKRCTSPPQPYYDCSIAEFNMTQDCEYYVFVRIEWHKDKPKIWKRGWIVGYIDKDEYFDRARFLKKGQEDGDNGFIVRANCYNLQIKELHEVTKDWLDES